MKPTLRVSRPWRKLFPAAFPDDVDWKATLTWPAGASADSGELWTQLTKATDARLERPRARSGVTVEQLPDNKGAILSEDKSGAYVHVTLEDLFLWERMDGTRTQIDLVVDYCLKFKAMVPARIAGLVETLRAQGLLDEAPDEVYPKLRDRLLGETFMGRVNGFIQTFLQREFAVSGIDGVVGAVFRRGGWLFYTRPALATLWLVTLTGLVAFLYLLTSQKFSVLGEGSVVQGALLFGAFQMVALFLHESAHALTVKAYGRRVRRAGFFLLFGLPGVFVDTTDIWPAGKRAQLAVTWAGPFCNLALGGLVALIIVAYPDWVFAPAAYQFALSQYVLNVFNLTPFIRLDGYYLLADWLEVPNLGTRATGYLQKSLPNRLRQAWAEGQLWPRFSREEKILLGFGLLSTLWIVNLMGIGVLSAPVRVFDTFRRLFTGGFANSNLVTIVFALLGVFFTAGLLLRTTQMIRGWLTRTGRSLQTAPGWRTGGTFALVTIGLSLLPDLLITQGQRVATSAAFYQHAILLAASALMTLYAVRLGRELRGSGWPPLPFGLALTGLSLLVLEGIDVYGQVMASPIAWPLTLPVLRLLALWSTIGGASLTAPLLAKLRGAPLGWAALLGLSGVIALGAAAWGASGSFLTVGGHAFLAASVIMCWQVTHQPMVLPRIPMQIETDDPSRMLKQAVYAVARELTQSLAEVAGPKAMRDLAFNFNNRIADTEWPQWLTMKGAFGEKFKGTIEERAAMYRATLAELHSLIAARLGQGFANGAQAQALAELPAPLRAIFQRWIMAGSGESADDDRLRLRLAGRRLAETMVIGCGRICGWHLTDQAIGGFNRAAAIANWPMYIRGNGRLADETSGDLLGLAQIYSEALQDLLGRVAAIAGPAFVERGVLQVYDSLPWEAREVTAHLLFERLSWARRLNQAHTDDPRAAFLHMVPLLGWLPPQEVAALAAIVTPRRVKSGHQVIARETYLDQALIVRRGSVQAIATANGIRRVVEQINSGGIIGVRSIVDHQPVPYAYVAQTEVEVWLVPAAYVAERLHSLLHLQDALDQDRATLTLLARIPLFSALDAVQRAKVIQVLETQRLSPNAVILQEGSASQGFFIVQQGEVEVVVGAVDGGERRVSLLGPGEFFGEAALLNRTPVTATVRARTDVELLRLPPNDFYALLASGLAAPLEQVQSRRAKERLRVSQIVAEMSGA